MDILSTKFVILFFFNYISVSWYKVYPNWKSLFMDNTILFFIKYLFSNIWRMWKKSSIIKLYNTYPQVFYEEELDVPLVLFDEVLDHVLRIDRIFRQPQGHLLLIGVSGAGKTTLSRFVAWMNGLSIFQIKVNHRDKKYGLIYSHE